MALGQPTGGILTLVQSARAALPPRPAPLRTIARRGVTAQSNRLPLRRVTDLENASSNSGHRPGHPEARFHHRRARVATGPFPARATACRADARLSAQIPRASLLNMDKAAEALACFEGKPSKDRTEPRLKPRWSKGFALEEELRDPAGRTWPLLRSPSRPMHDRAIEEKAANHSTG